MNASGAESAMEWATDADDLVSGAPRAGDQPPLIIAV
jgi:hypothetical protein